MSDALEQGIRSEVNNLAKSHIGFAKDNLFVLWFVKAYILGVEDQSADRWVNGGAGDGGLDAIVIDDKTEVVHFVQGKFRAPFGRNEQGAPIYKFISDCQNVCGANPTNLQSMLERLEPYTKELVGAAALKISKKGYRPRLYFITTGRVSNRARRETKRESLQKIEECTFEIFDEHEIRALYKDYRDGVAPPTPSAVLQIERDAGQFVERVDRSTGIKSWFFPVEAKSIKALYDLCGTRLFARNIRGYLGDATSINNAIRNTLKTSPENFFHFNNGITIVCSAAQYERGRSHQIQLWNPQVINGQQTVRTMAAHSGGGKACVLVKVIEVPRDDEDSYDEFISNIVAATNWQNPIKSSDLRANDTRQIKLQMALRALGYQYLRKRESKGEARKSYGKGYIQIKKEELAQAVAACEFDPHDTRSGVEKLFQNRYEDIFPNTNPFFYLPRYWLRRLATSAAAGDSQRGYAKWLVMNFAWGELAPLLRSEAAKKVFVEQLQLRGDAKLSRILEKALNEIYLVAGQYYRRAKKSEGNLEISRFYRDRKGHHVVFKKHWARFGNKHRNAFKAGKQKIAAELDKVMRGTE